MMATVHQVELEPTSLYNVCMSERGAWQLQVVMTWYAVANLYDTTWHVWHGFTPNSSGITNACTTCIEQLRATSHTNTRTHFGVYLGCALVCAGITHPLQG